MPPTDAQLIESYVRNRSEEAFAELVRRYLDLVHSAALRMVRSHALAEEVAQSVFVDLARSAGELPPGAILPAWLHRVTRRTAIDVVRREVRRQEREKLAMELNHHDSEAAVWDQIEPLLDDALAELDETDRAALLLRYFENKSLRQVGEALGTTDDAAQKRVGRAIERLRERLVRRGAVAGASALAAALSGNAVQAAPVGLMANVLSASASLVGGGAFSVPAIQVAMTTTQKILVAGALSLAVGYGVHQHYAVSGLRARLAITENVSGFASTEGGSASEMAGLRAHIDRLTEENDRLRRALDLSGQRQKELGGEAETARRSAALFMELARQANEERTGDTNPYPSIRHVMMGFGRMFLAKNQIDQLKRKATSSDEREALKTREMEVMMAMLKLAQAAKGFGLEDGSNGNVGDPADQGALLLHGIFDLSADQFDRVYRVLELRNAEAIANGAGASDAWVAGVPEAWSAANRAAISDIRKILTGEQSKILDEMADNMMLIRANPKQ